MAFTCKICGYTHSCRCGGKKCKCGMNLWEAKVAERLINLYNIEDTKTLVDMIFQWKNESTILNALWIESKIEEIQNSEPVYVKKSTILDDRFARTIWMKSVYCEYPSFNDEAQCIFCWRSRREWHMQPCLYYLKMRNQQDNLNSK